MQNNLYSIGEFSRMSGLPIKTLRFYHDKGLLVPCYVEADTGYRHYNLGNLERSQVIRALRALDFGLDRIAVILDGQPDDGDILEFLETQKIALQAEMEHRAQIVQALDGIIVRETEARELMQDTQDQVQEKELPALFVGGLRHTGSYQDCAKLFGKLGRSLGFQIKGKAMLLCYDEEYREEGADFEPCMPMRKPLKTSAARSDVHMRELPGGPCIALIHRGPYEDISRSYGRLLSHAKERGLSLRRPSREVYIKGPGMIFQGNPAKYLTEIQFLLTTRPGDA